MTDVHTKEQRSRNMSAVRSKNSKPELTVRSLLHTLGYRFRIHHRDLVGKPDIVLRRFGAVIFVHGCFWHMHRCKFGASTPTTNSAFWVSKRMANKERDKRQLKELRRNWSVLVVWECETKNLLSLEQKLTRFLRRPVVPA
jgi:DNA mismatch endonuclease, patch repair protein